MNISTFWEEISNNLKARKGEFTGTAGNENKIKNAVEKGKSINISNPSSKRTFHRDSDGSLLDQQIDIGDTSNNNENVEVGEVVSSAISNARYDPNDDSLNISYKSNPEKEYKFRAGGRNGLYEWINAPSKGRITQEWRETHRYPGF